MTREQARAKALALVTSAMGEKTEEARHTMAMVAVKLIAEHKLLEDEHLEAEKAPRVTVTGAAGDQARQRIRAEALDAIVDFGAEALAGVLRPRAARRRRPAATARRR